MRYVIFSLGHFFASDPELLQANLSAYYTRHGHPEISGAQIWGYLTKFRDPDNRIPLYQLRMGTSLFEFWSTNIQTRFPLAGGSSEEELALFKEFETAWVSMCCFSPKTIARIQEFIAYLAEHPDTVFVLVSHTNHAHFNYIQEQLNAQFGDTFPFAQFRFVTSMDSKKEAHPDMLVYAFENNILQHSEEDEVISCLRTITQAMLPQYIDVSYELPEIFDLADFEDKMRAVPSKSH